MSYIYLENLSVTNANAHAGYYLLGLPALTGITGFAHVIQRHWHEIFYEELDKKRRLKDGDKPTITGVGFIVHSIQMLNSHPKYVSYQVNSLRAGRITVPLVDRREVYLHFDLILRVNEEGKEHKTRLDKYVQSETFFNYLMGLPFCSGKLDLTGLSGARKAAASIFYFEKRRELISFVSRISTSSFIIEDASDFFRDAIRQTCGSDNLSVLLQHIKRQKRYSKEREKIPRDYRPWFIPLAVGYRALEDEPMNRRGVRGNFPHVFAEPVIGLGLARSLGSCRYQLQRNREIPALWDYRHESEEKLYIVKGHAL